MFASIRLSYWLTTNVPVRFPASSGAYNKYTKSEDVNLAPHKCSYKLTATTATATAAAASAQCPCQASRIYFNLSWIRPPFADVIDPFAITRGYCVKRNHTIMEIDEDAKYIYQCRIQIWDDWYHATAARSSQLAAGAFTWNCFCQQHLVAQFYCALDETDAKSIAMEEWQHHYTNSGD